MQTKGKGVKSWIILQTAYMEAPFPSVTIHPDFGRATQTLKRVRDG